MLKSKIYNNPPLIETVFEFFFIAENWTSVIPGLFYTKIQDKFPKISKVDFGMEFTFSHDGVKMDRGNNEVTRYSNQNGDTVIQLSPNFLTVNKLPVYESWESYYDTIQMAVESLLSLSNFKIKKIRNIGLKCVNRIDVGEVNASNLLDYLTIYPHIPKELDNLEAVPAYVVKYEKRYTDPGDILTVSVFTTVSTPESKAPVIVELHRFNKKGIEIADYKKWVERAHIQLRQTFDICFTEFAKNKFDEKLI